MKTVAEISEELQSTQRQLDELGAHKTTLVRELGEAQVREAVPHPLAGKKVRRIVTGFLSKETVQRGVVTQNTKAGRLYGMRGHSPVPGEWYVATSSGKTAYRLNIGAKATEWELDA